MEKYLFLQALILACLPFKFSVLSFRLGIFGGATFDIQKFPYQVEFLRNGKFKCGGSIISQNCVITAAHCVAGSPLNITLRLGSSFRMFGGVSVSVDEAIIHPDYERQTLNYDVALLRVYKSIEYNSDVQAIALDCDQEVADNTSCVVSGWGMTDDGSLSRELRAVTVNIINKAECQRNYFSGGVNFTLPTTAICAGVREGHKDSCNGDSGGPLVTNGTQVGIVSAGQECGSNVYPGFYTEVYKVCDWIKTTCRSGRG